LIGVTCKVKVISVCQNGLAGSEQEVAVRAKSPITAQNSSLICGTRTGIDASSECENKLFSLKRIVSVSEIVQKPLFLKYF
jgi:hypothetical protein